MHNVWKLQGKDDRDGDDENTGGQVEGKEVPGYLLREIILAADHGVVPCLLQLVVERRLCCDREVIAKVARHSSVVVLAS